MRLDQEAALIQGGDCFSHYHSADRVPTQDFMHGLQTIARQNPVTANYTVTAKDDYVLVDTSAGNVTITMPRAIGGVEVEILKMFPQNTIFVVPEGSDTILMATGATISIGNAAIHFKAFGTDWRPI